MYPAPTEFKSAFVALVGRPNSGKSTLVNTVLGEQLAIVTPMPQTTQRIMRGIYHGNGLQIVFVDTPGIHRGKHALNKSMYRQSTALFKDAGIDIIGYLVDLSRPMGKEEDEIADLIAAVEAPVVIIFNKADACADVKSAMDSFFTRYSVLSPKPRVVMCAKTPEAKEKFLDAIQPFVPSGPPYYPEEEVTDLNQRFFAAEFIRKQIIELTYEEVPHASCVEILEYKEFKDHHEITAVIHVETDGQKGILIGAKGKMVEKIKSRACRELALLTGVNVSISCRVVVTPKWRDNKRFLASMGLEG
jgi:GTP-binding protein Era